MKQIVVKWLNIVIAQTSDDIRIERGLGASPAVVKQYGRASNLSDKAVEMA